MQSVLDVYQESTTRSAFRDFLICDNCFWVASGISPATKEMASCPQCDMAISHIPLTPGERVTVSIGRTRGIELGFSGK